MDPFGDYFSDPEPQAEKNTLGVVDASMTWLAMAAVALVPTALALLFWPRALGPMVREVVPDGRRGVLLSPGAFFVLGLISLAIAVATLVPDAGGFLVTMGADVEAAAAEGEVSRIILRILPIFLVAVTIGVALQVFSLVVRTEGWKLSASVPAGLYVAAGGGLALIALEYTTWPFLGMEVSGPRKIAILSGLGVYGFWSVFSLFNAAEVDRLRAAGIAALFGATFPLCLLPFYG